MITRTIQNIQTVMARTVLQLFLYDPNRNSRQPTKTTIVTSTKLQLRPVQRFWKKLHCTSTDAISNHKLNNHLFSQRQQNINYTNEYDRLVSEFSKRLINTIWWDIKWKTKREWLIFYIVLVIRWKCIISFWENVYMHDRCLWAVVYWTS